MWVRSEYAGELSVLLTWASALVPWSVSALSPERGISFVVVRFPLFAFQFLFGIRIRGGEVPFLPVYAAPSFPERAGVVAAYRVWLAAAAIYALAFAASVVYYARDERFEAALRGRLGDRADPVRLLGALLFAAGIALAASTAMLWTSFAGVTVPLGAVLVPVFGAVLLRVERAPSATHE